MLGGWVYIMSNKPRGTLYVGVTSDLGQRISIFDVSSLSKLSPKYPVLSI